MNCRHFSYKSLLITVPLMAVGYATSAGAQPGTIPGLEPPTNLPAYLTSSAVAPTPSAYRVPAPPNITSGRLSLGMTYSIWHREDHPWKPQDVLNNYFLHRAISREQMAHLVDQKYTTIKFLLHWFPEVLHTTTGQTLTWDDDNDKYSLYGDMVVINYAQGTTHLPQAYWDEMLTFLEDAKDAGIQRAIISLNAGAQYTLKCKDNVGPRTHAEKAIGRQTYKNVISHLRDLQKHHDTPYLMLEYSNEIGPSRWRKNNGGDGGACSAAQEFYAMFNSIQAIYSWYFQKYGRSGITFSAITPGPAGASRLDAMLDALEGTGFRVPHTIHVHAYPYTGGSDNHSSTTTMVDTYLAVRAVLKDHGLLSGQRSFPMELINAETYYNDPDVAEGTSIYLDLHDDGPKGSINLTGILSWPIAPPELPGSTMAERWPYHPYTSCAFRIYLDPDTVFCSGF